MRRRVAAGVALVLFGGLRPAHAVPASSDLGSDHDVMSQTIIAPDDDAQLEDAEGRDVHIYEEWVPGDPSALPDETQEPSQSESPAL